jgi:hypothetical protein
MRAVLGARSTDFAHDWMWLDRTSAMARRPSTGLMGRRNVRSINSEVLPRFIRAARPVSL